MAPCLHCFNTSLLIKFFVCAVSGTCKEIISAPLTNSLRDFIAIAFPSGNFVSTSKNLTFIPIASAMILVCIPIFPYPINPMVLPLNSKLPFASLFQIPLCAAVFLSMILRINIMDDPITNSATLLVLL